MADLSLIDGSIAGGVVAIVARLVRDERERWKQSRNGGTPMDKLTRAVDSLAMETRKTRRTIIRTSKRQNKKLAAIVANSEKQTELQKESEKVQDLMAKALNKLSVQTAVLLERDRG